MCVMVKVLKSKDVETCKTCHGSGQVRMQQGFFSVQQTCGTCRGQGKIIKTLVRHVMVQVLPIASKRWKLQFQRV